MLASPPSDSSAPLDDLRLVLEAAEDAQLPARAARSQQAVRAFPEAPDPLRTEFQRDRDRILAARAFRRLKDKTQVFIAPAGDHFRTRLTHTLEVSSVSRAVARGLRLNEDLVEAIALGHDLGHTPFGHSGEAVLARLVPGGFRHNFHGVRIVEHLEPLNLTREVRDGIAHHTGPEDPFTLEGQVVKIGDRVAYLHHDVEDAIRGGVLREAELPASYLELGDTPELRRDAMILDLIAANRRKVQASPANEGQASKLEEGAIAMSPAMWNVLMELRTFMFRHVYLGSEAKREERKVQRILEVLFHHFLEHPAEVQDALRDRCDPDPVKATADYLAGMTDRYAIDRHEALFSPRPWRKPADA